MKKRVVSLLLCLIMALSLIPTAAFATEGENVEETTPVVEAQAEPAAETPAEPDGKAQAAPEAAVKTPVITDEAALQQRGSNQNPTRKLGWKYAKISEKDNGGYTITPAGTNDLSGTVTVKIGGTELTKNTGKEDISKNDTRDVTISVADGYYIAYVVLCCNDNSKRTGEGYSCQTAQGEQAFGKNGEPSTSTVTISVADLYNNTPHGYNDKINFWLMIMVKETPDPVYVGYDIGTASGANFTGIAPVDTSTPISGAEWISGTYNAKYANLNKTTPTHTALSISDAARNAALAAGYEFDGWKVVRYRDYNDRTNEFSDQMSTDSGKVSSGASVSLLTHTKLVAQWKEVEKPTTGNLIITKNVEGGPTGTSAPTSFTFTVTDSLGKKVEYKGSENITVPANDKLIIPDLPLGTYTVTEQSANINGYDLNTKYTVGTTTTKEPAQVEVKATGATVTVTNTYTKHELKVKVVPATLTIKKVDEDGNALQGVEFTLYDKGEQVGEPKTTDTDGFCTFTNLTNPDGVHSYTFKETKALLGYKELTTEWNVALTGIRSDLEEVKDDDGKLIGYQRTLTWSVDSVTNVDDDNDALRWDGDDNAYVITNTRATGNLTIAKEVDGIDVDNVTQTFQFKVYTVNGTEKVLYNTYTATTRDPAEITGLPTGQYFVTEVATSADISGYSRNTTYQSGNVYGTPDVNGIYVEVNEDDTTTVVVTNTYTKNTANLVITKTLNEALPADMTFKFNVMKGTDPAIIGAEITIKAGETSGTAIVKNLTVGKTYTVQEVEKSAQLDGYTVAIPEAQKVTISGVATDNTVTFENVYTKNTGTLTISKVLKGDLVATDFDKPFTFTIWKGTEKKDTVEVWPGNPVTLTLNPGKYTIVEDKADVEGYDLTTSFEPDYRVEVKAGENTAVVATNTYTKTVTPAPEEHTFTIDITKNIELLKRTSRNPGKASFTFQAYMVDEQKNVTVLGNVTIETRGTKSASGKLTFTLTDEQLTYGATVYVREVEGNARGWTYDDAIYELKIGRTGEIVTGDTDLTFTNVYYRKASNNTPTDDKTVKSVKTGDMGIAMYAMTSLLSLGGAALVIKKRKDEK